MTGYQHIPHGFEPVFDERSRVLVLGSFPSVLSRANDFYYGNPRNRFWRVMARVLGERVPAGRLYHRWLEPQSGLAAQVLPSTSPANAAWGEERLVAAWSEVLLPLLP